MTREQLAKLKAGAVIKHKRTKTLRVLAAPAKSPHGRLCCALIKVGSSWTDPNPLAWYDPWEICRSYDVTDHPRMLALVRSIPLFFVAKSGVISPTGVRR